MRVYTFLSEVPGKDREEELALVELWKRSWAAHGWEPTVLSREDLPNDRVSRAMLRHFQGLPSKNKRNLDYWCYARWLAVAERGGGFLSDYDVINYSFTPREPGSLTTYDRWIPCLASGTEEELRRVLSWFMQERFGLIDRLFRKPHTSDMLILQKHRNEICIGEGDCAEYGLPGWTTAHAVHYSNRAMKADGLTPRHLHIEKLRPLQTTS